jgi:hypothetical protein
MCRNLSTKKWIESLISSFFFYRFCSSQVHYICNRTPFFCSVLFRNITCNAPPTFCPPLARASGSCFVYLVSVRHLLSARAKGTRWQGGWVALLAVICSPITVSWITKDSSIAVSSILIKKEIFLIELILQIIDRWLLLTCRSYKDFRYAIKQLHYKWYNLLYICALSHLH